MMKESDDDNEMLRKLMKGEWSQEHFLQEFHPELDREELVLDRLKDAKRLKSAAKVNFALNIGFIFGFTQKHFDILCDLLVADWHYSHEDLVTAIDEFKDERAIPLLYKSALSKFSYLDYDDACALARKAIWALGKIGNHEAEIALENLEECKESTISQYAREQLERVRSRHS